MVLWGEKLVTQSLQVHLLSPINPWLACPICKLLQGELYGNPNHEASEFCQAMLEEQDGTCPVSSNHFGASCFLLSWIAQNCFRQSLFRGANSSPKNTFGGPKNVTKFHSSETAERANKCKIGGPKRKFRCARKVAQKEDILHLRPEDKVLARDVASQRMSDFDCIRLVWRMCHLPSKSTGRTKSIRSGTCMRCSGIRGHGNMDEKNGAHQKLQVPALAYPIPQLMLS